jgi:2-amino-4-hydroxy-6-hydroxymethyldihydropteridine diphosphokinase
MPKPPERRPARDAAVAFGANLGRPEELLNRAEALLAAAPRLRPKARSSVWLTEPVGGPPGQDWYHNRVILYETDMGAAGLMALLLKVEKALGRVRAERWGPRAIDLDLLFLGQQQLRNPFVTIPHPRMAERGFVLRPLAEVAPEWVHPALGLSVSELLGRLPGDGPGLLRKGEGPLERGRGAPAGPGGPGPGETR